MNKEEIEKMFKENPIKTIKCGDIEIPVEYLKQTTVNIDGKKYIQLQQENQELKAKLELYENGVYFSSEVDEKDKEIDKLKKQLEESKENYNCLLKQKEQFEYIMSKQVDYQGQQKEFIEYMNKTIEELECDDVDDEEMKGYLIQRIDTFKEILSKFREIIGSDINVGTKGGKDAIK